MRLLCGVPTEIACTPGALDPFAALTPTDSPAEVRLEVAPAARLPRRSGALLFRGPDFEVREDRRHLELRLSEAGRSVAHCRLTAEGGTLLLRPGLSPSERALVHELLPELVVAHLWPLRGLAYLHAAAALGPRGARLLLGPSGRGKSTAARLLAAAGEPTICADRCAVSPRARWVAAAPWHGGEPSAGRRVALAEIFALSREGPSRLRRLTPAEAVAALSATAFLPRWWPAGLEAGLDALVALAAAVPLFELCAPPDERLVLQVLEAA